MSELSSGSLPIDVDAAHEHFVVTPSIRAHLRTLACHLSGSRSALLLEGPTSAGKTTLVSFLAKLTGHALLRINNHEHTDVQEYTGQYVCNEKGEIVFEEGPLVRAAREGSWVVIDELNLAPSEVLEGKFRDRGRQLNTK